jgi:hypothetical protein
MAANTNYITDGAVRIDMTLPASAAVGSTIRITNKNAGGYFRIRQPIGDTMYFDQLATTTGLAGYIEVTNNGARASIEIVCVTTDVDWNVLSSIGTFTIV